MNLGEQNLNQEKQNLQSTLSRKKIKQIKRIHTHIKKSRQRKIWRNCFLWSWLFSLDVFLICMYLNLVVCMYACMHVSM